MALETVPYVEQALSHSAELFRRAIQTFLGGGGCVSPTDLVVSAQGTPNMSVLVAPGQVWMPGTLSSTSGFPTNRNAQTGYGMPSTFNEQGSYYAWNSASTTLTISAANPTNPRIDLIVASVQDAFYSGSNNQALLQVITGTPAPSPSPPTPPATTIVIAQVLVPANTTSITSGDITDARSFMQLQSPQKGNPAGLIYSTTGGTAGSAAQIVCGSTSFLYGGMTTNGALFVPVAGIYEVTAFWAGAAPPDNTELYTSYGHNTTGISQVIGGGTTYGAGGAQIVPAPGSGMVQCAAGDYIALVASANSSTTIQASPGFYPFLSVALVSQ